MADDVNKKKIRFDLSPAESGEQLDWAEALKFYLYHIVAMTIIVFLSVIVFRFTVVFLMVVFSFNPENMTVLGFNIINLLDNWLVNIMIAIYCGLLFHYIYTVKGLKSFYYILIGIIVVSISFFIKIWLGGPIALIFTAILTTREKREETLNFKEDKSGFFVESVCPKCGSNAIEYCNKFNFKEKIKHLLLGIGSIIGGIFLIYNHIILTFDVKDLESLGDFTRDFLFSSMGAILLGLGILLIIAEVITYLTNMSILSKFNAKCNICYTFFDIRNDV
ncbi:MAG: hypothetical protein ACOCZT_00155 [Halanaerobiales bacterium]